MRWMSGCLCLAFLTVAVGADDKPFGLTSKEAAGGWLMLFDGETTFGWTIDGNAEVLDGALVLGGEQATIAVTVGEFMTFDYVLEVANIKGRPRLRLVTSDPGPIFAGGPKRGSYHGAVNPKAGPIRIEVPARGRVEIRRFNIRPTRQTPLFNGKDLAGWKKYGEDTKRVKSNFSVTKEGWLNVKNGPGDLQTAALYDDFLLQLECISNGKNLNSGIFFRALPGEYQQGYEAQIHNGYKDGDRAKPSDFGTGAIYRRKPARKVIPNDGEWFTMTVLARGPQLLTWVNGYPTCDFKDERSPNDNARNGRKTGKGAISIQGHDPTTDLSFRNIRIGELK